MAEAHADAHGASGHHSATTGDADAGSAVPNTDAFACLLKKYVDDDGFVDYHSLSQDAESLKGLNEYISALASVDLKSLDRDQSLATMINAYNAFTLRLIHEYILSEGDLDSIYDIPEAKRWKAERWVLDGKKVSLDRLEHEWIRPNFREPRVHWALVCAAYSCPRLLNEPFVGERLEEQLNLQAAYVHQDRRYFYFQGDVLYITELYRWFKGDFDQVDGSPLKHAARYSPRLAQMLAQGRQPEVRYIPYSWALNSQRKRDNP